MQSLVSKAGLGTVQLGLPYGNSSHQPLLSESVAFDILGAAAEYGIRFFDTAAAYGESELRIGRSGVLKRHPDIEISTKIPRVDRPIWSNYQSYKQFVSQCMNKSRELLCINKFGLLQFHQCDVDFLRAPSVRAVIQELLDSRAIQSAGVSVYDPVEANAAIESGIFAAIQVPINILDTRFADPIFLNRVKAKKIRLIARSIFFQGILIRDAAIPNVAKANELRTLKAQICEISDQSKELPDQLALNYMFVNLADAYDIVLMGVDSLPTLMANLEMLKKCHRVDDRITEQFQQLQTQTKASRLFDPRTWNTASP